MPNISSLANELWIQIFESITDPSDINTVVRTCRKFYALGIRALAQRVHWRDPRLFAKNLPFWQHNPTFSNLPRSLTISFSAYRSPNPGDVFHNTSVVGLDGILQQILPPPPPPPPPAGPAHIFHHSFLNQASTRHHPRFVASTVLYTAVVNLVPSFTRLERLVFMECLLPTAIYTIIHALPRLRSLDIQSCTLPPTAAMHIDHATLPITHLTLRNIEGSMGSWPRSNLYQMLTLCTAHNLQTLYVDYRANVFQLFTGPSPQFPVPPFLQRLEVRMPPQNIWPSDAHQAHMLLIQPLISFLEICPTIECLSIYNHMPNFTLAADALPNLRSYRGPLSTVVTVTGRRPMEYLDIRKYAKSMADLTDGLSTVAQNHRNLQTLCVLLEKWDDEILYAVTQLFLNLRRLKIIYNDGGPTEDTLLGVGARFLYRLKNLHNVQIYNSLTPPTDHLFGNKAQLIFGTNEPPVFEEEWEADDSDLQNNPTFFYSRFKLPLPTPPPHPDAEEELKELIGVWRRYCPNLREVQLVSGFIWRRDHDGDEWCKRKFEWLDGERNFVL